MARNFNQLSAIFVLLMMASPSPAGTREAYRSVQRGIQQYKSADYKAAAESFGDALSESPQDLRIVYNQACAAQARDELDEAVALFQKAALTDDSQLAVRCRYNLGVIAAKRARTTFGDKPEEADKETRAEGLKHLWLAVAHYRDCLSTDPDHREARHNLELIRLWMKNMQQEWRERDRQRAREKMDLFAFLRFIDSQQRGLRSTTRSLAQVPTSPKRRHALRIAANSQRELTDEIKPLKQKIEATIDEALPASADPSQQQAFERQRDEILPPLLNLANAAGREMLAAADRLDDDQVDEAAQSQTTAVETLDELFMALTDYPHLLERAIAEQELLTDRVAFSVDNPEGQQTLDAPDVAWRQRFVEDWVRMLVLKAKNNLPRVADKIGAEGVPPQSANDPETAPDEGQPNDTAPSPQATTDHETVQDKRKPLHESMEKAVELGPQVVELLRSATEELHEHQPGEALPHQEQALKLLREIAEPLRKEQQKQQEEQENKNQDEQKQQEQPPEQSKPQEDEKKEDTEEKPRQGQQQQEKRQQQPMSEKEMQALMQNMQERKRKRDEELKRIRALIAKPSSVDKDW